MKKFNMKNMSIKKSVLSLGCAAALSVSSLYADADLAQKANDPTAPLMAVQLIDNYTSDFLQ